MNKTAVLISQKPGLHAIRSFRLLDITATSSFEPDADVMIYPNSQDKYPVNIIGEHVDSKENRIGLKLSTRHPFHAKIYLEFLYSDYPNWKLESVLNTGS